jgi:hypothetical protein
VIHIAEVEQLIREEGAFSFVDTDGLVYIYPGTHPRLKQMRRLVKDRVDELGRFLTVQVVKQKGEI